MADRTVTVRLRLDATQWAAGQNAAVRANDRLATSSHAAVTRAERDAQRTATAVQGTFRGMATAGTAALGQLDAAAARSAQAVSRSSAAAAASTRQVGVAAGELPATFRAAGTAGTTALGRIDAAAAASTRAVTEVGAGMSAATAAAAAGTSELSLATRLAVAEAARSTRLMTASTTATSAALDTTSARARVMGSAVVTAAGQSERSLKATRTGALLLVAAFGLAVYASSRFETAMSGVKAATQAGARELGQLRQAAIQAGATTQYSATQAANAETELAKAGVSTADILGGALRGTLNLAAAGQMDVADSAVVAAKAMNSFGLQGSDMAHIADVIAAAAGKSATDVHGMSLAFAQSSLLAHQTGLSLEQTAGSLALFAQNGLVGSDAGTSLKTMLMRLTPQSAEARDVMQKLGFSAYDSAGNFVGLSETARRMQKSFSGLTPEARNAALGVIFGSDAIRAATIVTQAGAAGIDTWTRAANDQGYAARYAATQTDNLQGDLQRLKSALETALIQSGSAANGVLRDMAQALTGVVRWYSSLSPEVQKSVTVLGGLAGVIGLVSAGLLLMLPRIMTVRRELVALGLTAERTGRLLGVMGRLTVVIGALTALSYAGEKISSSFDKAGPNVTKLTNSLVDLANTGKVTGEAAKAFGADMDGFGESVQRIAHAGGLTKFNDELTKLGHGLFGGKAGGLKDAEAQVKAVDQSLADLVSSGNSDAASKAFKELAADAEQHGTSTKKLMTLLPQYSDALAGADTQQKLSAESSKKLGDSEAATAGDLQDTRTQVEKLTDALNALNGVNIDSAESEISFRQSLADMRQAVKENGHSLDVTTDKGRKVKQAFLDAAKAAAAHAEAVGKQKDSVNAGDRVFAQDIEILKRQMRQAGFSREAINRLVAAYARVPSSVSTAVRVRDDASQELEAIRGRLAKTKGKSITVKALTNGAEQQLKALGFRVTHMKGGTVRISVPTGSQTAAVARLQAHLDALKDRTVVLTIRQAVDKGLMSSQGAKNAIDTRRADGGVIPGYAPRVDSVHALLSPGEGVLVPEAVRKLGGAKAIEMLNRWGRYGTMRFADGGVVGPQRFAGGGIAYTPTVAPQLGSPSDARQRYDDLTQQLRDAWRTLNAAMDTARDRARSLRDAESNLNRVRSHHHTENQLLAAEKRLRDAREASAKAARAVAGARGSVNSLDQQLGLANGSKVPGAFNLGSYQKLLGQSLAQTNAWRASLDKIAKRGGGEVRDILEGMGQDGYALVQALAKAGDKQFADIVKKLKATAGVASASLADFQRQVNASTKTNAQFASDLQKLAAGGYGDLAQALAAQGDAAAQDLARQAAGNSKAAAAANSSVKAAGQALTGDDLANSLTLLSTLRGGKGRGFADLVRAGLDVGTIRALVPKIMKQITTLPAQYRTEFLKEWAGQRGVTAMARGGLLTRPTAVLAAEAGVPEWFIPQNGSARSAALLSAAAAGMGYQLVPAGRWAGQAPAASGGTTHIDRSQTLHLHGAHQGLAEQRADLLRHMQFVG